MISSSRLAVLALVGLAFVGASADAQYSATARPTIIPYPVNPNQQIAPNLTYRQAAYNMAVLGRGASQIPPYLYGYNPYPSPIIASGPAISAPIAPVVSASPYALSTAPVGNPYLTGSAALSSSPYSLSTVGGGGTGYGYTPYYSPYGGGYQDPYSSTIQGLASLTSATGQYYVSVQRARLLREQSRQMALDTTRKRLELEAWYETIRPTAPKMLAREQANALDQARMGGSTARVWSGQDLNTLLKNIQKQLGTSQLKNGSTVPLAEDTLKSINLTSGATTGNAGMLKDGVKLAWPQALDDQKTTEEARKRLARDLRSAVDLIKDGETVKSELLKTIRSDYSTIKNKLSDSADELSMAQYIESKRYLNQLDAAIKALSDPNAKKYFNNNWIGKTKNVAELVKHMSSEGLTFAPATPGDEAAYNALYTALRSFDSSLSSQK
jgi:hypothetical protein